MAVHSVDSQLTSYASDSFTSSVQIHRRRQVHRYVRNDHFKAIVLPIPQLPSIPVVTYSTPDCVILHIKVLQSTIMLLVFPLLLYVVRAAVLYLLTLQNPSCMVMVLYRMVPYNMVRSISRTFRDLPDSLYAA